MIFPPAFETQYQTLDDDYQLFITVVCSIAYNAAVDTLNQIMLDAIDISMNEHGDIKTEITNIPTQQQLIDTLKTNMLTGIDNNHTFAAGDKT